MQRLFLILDARHWTSRGAHNVNSSADKKDSHGAYKNKKKKEEKKRKREREK
jgi:hypothetical protein